VRIYAGIDEAGYGPLLGPLCVAVSAFEISDEGAPRPDLWLALEGAVTRDKRDPRRRVPVDDSKRLKGQGSARVHPLRDLERGVLAFASTLGAAPPQWNESALFGLLRCANLRSPWYAGEGAVPCANDASSLAIDAALLRRAMMGASLRLAALSCVMLDGLDFNLACDRAGSKSAVNLSAALSLAAQARALAGPGASAEIVLDRHGGRTHYLEELLLHFSGSRIRIESEDERLSRYAICDDRGSWWISFMTEGEKAHLPIALASMTAKYVRELAMRRLNAWFASHQPSVRPTAGYVEDGRRFVQEVEPTIRRTGLDRRALIREV